jgi:hypothetical protein
MRNSHRLLLGNRTPFLLGFFAGTILVGVLTFSTLNGVEDREIPNEVMPNPSVSTAANEKYSLSQEEKEYSLEIRAYREKASEIAEDLDTNAEVFELLVSRSNSATAGSQNPFAEEVTEPRRVTAVNTGSGSPAEYLEIDPVLLLENQASVTITGVDPLAPRKLTLWRKQGYDVARVASGQSDSLGSFDFPQVIVPIKGLELLVTGSDSRNPLTDPRVVGIHHQPPMPPPGLSSHGDVIDGMTFRLHPALSEGHFTITSLDNEVAQQIDIQESPTGFAAGIELPETTRVLLEDDVDCVGYQVAQTLEDGRESRRIPLPCTWTSL